MLEALAPAQEHGVLHELEVDRSSGMDTRRLSRALTLAFIICSPSPAPLRRVDEGVPPWQVRYRDSAGHERARSFLKKVDANRFAVTVEADILRGEWTDPRLSKTTVAEWSERW